MKILLAVHQFFPEFSAGTEVLTCAVARELIRLGHEIRIFTGFPGKKNLPDESRFDSYLFQGIKVHRFHHAYSPMGSQTTLLALDYDNRLAASFFSMVLDQFKPDIVHFFHMFRLGSGLVEKTVEMGVPSFMTVTDFWAICPMIQLMLPNGQVCSGPDNEAGNCIKHLAMLQFPGFSASLIRNIPNSGFARLANFAKRARLVPAKYKREFDALGERVGVNVLRVNQLRKIIVPTAVMRDTLVRFGVFEENIQKIEFGIDFDEGSVRCKLPGSLKIGFIGSLVQHKGCHVLIEAFQRLPAGVASLSIYGDTNAHLEYATKLKAMAKGDTGIQFRGVFDNKDISTVLAEMDVLVLPSLWQENSPLVVLAAQARRCPVIASEIAGLKDIVLHETNGLLFPAGNSAELAEMLRRVSANPDMVNRLSAQSILPKSTACYVENLIEVWQEANHRQQKLARCP